MKNHVFVLTLLLMGPLLRAQSLLRDISFHNNQSTTNTSIRHIAVYPDQRILACGDFSNFDGTLRRSLIRLDRNGNLDAGFISPLINGLVHAIAIQTWDNRIVIGGSFTLVNGFSRGGLARFNEDGSLDMSFAIGSGIGSGYADDLSVRALVIADDPDPAKRYIYAGGQFQTFNGFATGTRGGLVRLLSDGNRDATYNPQVTSGPVYAMKADALGRLVIGGEFWYIAGAMQVRLARLNTNGTRDASFNTAPFGPYSSVTSIGIDPSGRILAGGWFTQFNGANHNHLVRLNPNGSVDNSFVTGTGLANGLSTHTNGTEARSFVFLQDGTIVVGGNFTIYNGIPCGNIICLNEDGSLSQWSSGNGFNSNVMNLQLQEAIDGEQRILAGGFFESYHDYNQGTIMRLIPMMNVLRNDSTGIPGHGRKRAEAGGIDRKLVNRSSDQHAREPTVQAFPNPFAGKLNILTHFDTPMNCRIQILSMSGQLVLTSEKLILAGKQTLVLDQQIPANFDQFILVLSHEKGKSTFHIMRR